MKLTVRMSSLCSAAVVADQNAKLSIFATRPAIYAPPFNFLSEFLATIALLLGAQLISMVRGSRWGRERSEHMGP